MIPSGADYSTHDKAVGGLVLIIVASCVMLWLSGRRRTALGLPVVLFVVAVLVETSSPGLVDGIR